MVQRVRGYLAHRRILGFRLRSEGYLLLNFARYSDRHSGCGPLTNKLAITWARLPKASNRPRWARRLEAVRRLAKYLAATDSRTELPPRPNLLAFGFGLYDDLAFDAKRPIKSGKQLYY